MQSSILRQFQKSLSRSIWWIALGSAGKTMEASRVPLWEVTTVIPSIVPTHWAHSFMPGPSHHSPTSIFIKNCKLFVPSFCQSTSKTVLALQSLPSPLFVSSLPQSPNAFELPQRTGVLFSDWWKETAGLSQRAWQEGREQTETQLSPGLEAVAQHKALQL